MRVIQDAIITQGTKVLIRVDMDVPLENGNILEQYRLEAALETLRYIISKGGIPIIMGHIGQPQGLYVETLSTKQLLPYFNEKLGENSFELLENLRFDKREEENSEELAKELATKGNIYVNESFATCHRVHTSIVEIAKQLPSYAGFRLQKELTILNKVKKEAKKPFVVIIGGAKLESKKPIIDTFLKIADHVLIGGKLGLEWEKEIPENLHLPKDYAMEQRDIGKTTIEEFENIIKTASTILWAGPMGMYEKDEYITGTKAITDSIEKNKNAWSIIGGGDTIAAVTKLGKQSIFSFISTGGGAMLNYLAKDTLPGVEALTNE